MNSILSFIKKARLLAFTSILLGGVAFFHSGVFATTYTVDNTSDSGAGSLRQAIIDANANPGPDTITFNIPGAGPHKITPLTQLDNIVDQVTIDGTSQPGTVCGSSRLLQVELDFTSAWSSSNSAASIAFEAGSDGSVLKGLSIYGQDDGVNGSGNEDWGVRVKSDDITITCNNLGLLANGESSGDTAVGASAVSVLNGARNTTVGGTSMDERNVISGFISGVDTTCDVALLPEVNIESLKVIGNYFGTNTEGTSALDGNSNQLRNLSASISVDCVDGMQIGGSNPGERNVFGGGAIGSISLAGSTFIGSPLRNVIIKGNYIGVGSDGNVGPGFGGGKFGIGASTFPANSLTGGSAPDQETYNVIIGGESDADANVITGFTESGINLSKMSFPFPGMTTSSYSPRNVSILGNSVYGNGLGIDICDSLDIFPSSPTAYQCTEGGGPNVNDAGDVDDGPNDNLNSPNINAVKESGPDTNITFSADLPAGDYRIEFFSNTTPHASGYGEGQTYLGYVNITSSGTGLQKFNTMLSGVTGALNVRSTATKIDGTTTYGFGPTSEFGSVDADNDGIIDMDDIDADNDGIPDSIEDANTDGDNDPATGSTDTDADGIPDYMDLDADGDGILDVVEAGHEAADADGDGRVDGAVGANGLPDAVETSADSGAINYTVRDFDSDGKYDFQDIDSDDDGVSDVIEAGGVDSNGDGLQDDSADTDGDGVVDSVDVDNSGSALPLTNTDGDGNSDYLDIDDDNDGIPTINEDTSGDGNPTNDDVDGDGTPNYLDLDSDGDGVKDIVEAAGQDSGVDTNNDGMVDSSSDTDVDGLADVFDADNGGTSVNPLIDTDGDGMADPYDVDDDGDGIDTINEDTSGDGNPTNDDVDGDGTPNYLDLDSDNGGVSDKRRNQ
jgi:hypothetical protein